MIAAILVLAVLAILLLVWSLARAAAIGDRELDDLNRDDR